MADEDSSVGKKISELPIVQAADDDSWIIINFRGTTSRIEKSKLLAAQRTRGSHAAAYRSARR